MTIYVAVDGNETGKHLEKYLLSNDLEMIRTLSSELNLQIERLRSFLAGAGGEILMCGGDNILAAVDDSIFMEIREMIPKLQEGEVHFSTGIGTSIRNAYLALKYAKALHAYEMSFDGEAFYIPEQDGRN